MLQYIISLDNSVYNFLATHSSQLLFKVSTAFTFLGEAEIILVILIGLAILPVIRKKILLLIVGSVFVEAIISESLKRLVARARPQEILYHVSRTGFSFPSNHAVIAVVFYGFLGYYLALFLSKKYQKIIVYILTSLLVIFIGLSRLVLEVHLFSDVVAGWLIGSIILFITIRFHKKMEKRDNTAVNS